MQQTSNSRVSDVEAEHGEVHSGAHQVRPHRAIVRPADHLRLRTLHACNAVALASKIQQNECMSFDEQRNSNIVQSDTKTCVSRTWAMKIKLIETGQKLELVKE